MSGQCHGTSKRLYWVRTVLHGQCWFQSCEIVNKYFKVLRVRADVKLTVLKPHITERYRQELSHSLTHTQTPTG